MYFIEIVNKFERMIDTYRLLLMNVISTFKSRVAHCNVTGTSPQRRRDVSYLDRYGSFLPPNLLSLARKLQHRMVDSHKATLARATKELIRLSSAPDLDTIKNSLAKYPLGLGAFKKLLQLKNRKLSEMTSSLSRPVVHMYSTQNRLLRQLPEVMPEVIPELPGLSSRDIDVYSEVLPSLLQVGGDMLSYHVNSVMSRFVNLLSGQHFFPRLFLKSKATNAAKCC